ncbi:gp062 (endogenous virus) [Lactococcus phage KSY1]|uniref:Gp062 n=1 Tax=Lactococcus phage KSY1 TaxID=2913972 RepID=A6MAC7_9CAUD|nr:gp062 [Lactococcus phage KSY1]ABG21605.1 gp062 [Lactococcus phage KSY1]
MVGSTAAFIRLRANVAITSGSAFGCSFRVPI